MKYLTDYTTKGLDEALNHYGAFFAFGKQQFEEQRTPGVKYVSLGAGLICPEENVKALIKAINDNHTKGIIQDVAENGAEAIIEREYFNYEMQISYDATDFNDEMNEYKKVFPDIFTNDLINKICHKCYRKAIDNDWI